MSGAAAVAIGRLRADGPWLGIVAEEAGFRLAVAFPGSAPVTSRARGTRRIAELLAAAIAYFEEALDPPPPELEATQADLAGLLAWIAEAETDAVRSRLIGQALDAIDDGLAGDAVVARLSEARRGLGSEANEQDDAIDLLAQRVRELGRTSAAGEAAPSV